MDRRNFVKQNLKISALAGIGGLSVYPKTIMGDINILQEEKEPHQFNLNYAPHLGMFQNLAGKDVIDQLNFMADQGFTAFEDNNMRTRPIAEQEAMAKTMEKRGITMGVFVAHEILNN